MCRIIVLRILMLFTLAFLCACKDSIKIESGVSLDLATYRSANITNVTYDIDFNIPLCIDSVVYASERISFIYKGTQDLQLDFKVDSVEQIISVKAYNQLVDWLYKDEHIIIPRSALNDSVDIAIEFIAGNRSLNRNPEYLYSLAVPDRARTIYPCFDQPDMKCRYQLSLTVPEEWVAVGNSCIINSSSPICGVKQYEFETSLPLSTYHFSFVAGKFECYSEVRAGDTVKMYYRETDPYKVSQVADVVDLTFKSVEWLEEYTGVPMPYKKNDLIAIPGFQFGGMEHPGAILYADYVVFKEKNATPNDYFQRASTIAHENTHLWFGDLVTMKWFNDVWTKEVFANYISAKIVEPEFPELDHDLNFLTSYVGAAIAEDRTKGTNAIQQNLDNMQNAGLLYGNIIYDKAPVMMRNMEAMMGSDSFKVAIQEYVRSFYHANATWDDLITIMVKYAPNLNLENFSYAWVKEPGMPHIDFKLGNKELIVKQIDPLGRGLVWPQSIMVALIDSVGLRRELRVDIDSLFINIPLEKNYVAVVPNIDGMGYGRMTADIDYLLENWNLSPTRLEMQAVLMQLYEEYLNGEVDVVKYYNSLLNGLKSHTDIQICSTLSGDIFTILADAHNEMRDKIESDLQQVAKEHRNSVVADMIYRSLSVSCRGEQLLDYFYNVWQEANDERLTENNYISIALALALKIPERADEIITTQRSRITNADVLRRYDFVSPACSADTVVMDSVFNALLVAENRVVEPWVQAALSYLNSRYREPYSNKYILPALTELQEIQRTGDIFFPKGWCNSLLSGHRSMEALQLVQVFLDNNPNYPQLLKTKLLQSVYNLERVAHQ